MTAIHILCDDVHAGLRAPSDLTVYVARFFLWLNQAGINAKHDDLASLPTPHRGQGLVHDYYERLLATDADLRAQGHSAPAKELADRAGIKRTTMRSRLRTARELQRKREG